MSLQVYRVKVGGEKICVSQAGIMESAVYQRYCSGSFAFVHSSELMAENGHDPVGDCFLKLVELTLHFPPSSVVGNLRL